MRVYGQINYVLLLCGLFMKLKDLNTLMGLNLRALRLESKMTQEQLADHLGVSTGLIPRWETGEKGIGKSVMLKLCEIFNVKPHVFYVDNRSAVRASFHEQKMVYKIRDAEKFGVDDLIMEHCEVIIDWAKRKQKATSPDVFAGQDDKMPTAKSRPAPRLPRTYGSKRGSR